MMLAARRLRGHTTIYDVFFPFVLLHWGQHENLLMSFQLAFVTSVVLVGVILLTIACCGVRLNLVPAVLITMCLVGAGLCGLNGLAYLPALAFWLLFSGICRLYENAPHNRRDGLLLILLAMVPPTLVAGYFIGFPFHPCHWPGILATAATSLQFLASSIGYGARGSWPISGLLVSAVFTYSLLQLYRVFRTQPGERIRAAGLFCFLGGLGSLAAAVGIGRACLGPQAGFELAT